MIGPLPVFLLYWLLVTALLAVAYPSRASAVGAIVVLASAWTLRVVLRRRVRRIAAASLPAESGGLRGSRDCDRAAREMLASGTPLSVRGLQVRLDLFALAPGGRPRHIAAAWGHDEVRA